MLLGIVAVQNEPLGSGSPSKGDGLSRTATPFGSLDWVATSVVLRRLVAQLAIVFLAYFIAGKLGQATSNIRSSNLGPVWPAYGIALAAFIAFGRSVWPGIAASAFLVAFSASVPALAAAGQAAGATAAGLTGAYVLRRIPRFDPSLPRLRDALGLILVGAFGSGCISASIGVFSLYATGVQAYSGLASAWLIYWLGDSTGVLLITPLVFTLPQLFVASSRRKLLELVALLALLAAACLIIFGDLPLMPVRLHVLAFAVLPFVMWAAINIGVGGVSLSVLLIATIATIATALGFGPFAENSPFINAVLLDVLFVVLAISGLALAAVIVEREAAMLERHRLIREQAGMETRRRLAAIVESSDDAIFSKSLDGTILSWNTGAQRIFGFPASELVGQPASSTIVPPELTDEENGFVSRLRAGERIQRYETIRLTKSGTKIDVSLTISPLLDSAGTSVGTAVVARDITERKKVQKALSKVSQRLLHAQEQERARIARELHDDIGQRIALLAMKLPGQSVELRDQISEIASAVHALSHNLHSSKIELLGIANAMERYCEEFSSGQGVVVDFNAGDLSPALPPEMSLCFFRVLQGALQNSAKHSGVGHVEVRLWTDQRDLHLEVTDAGVGFDLKTVQMGQGLGLVSMEERLKLVDGTLLVETRPRQGTRIHARAPISIRNDSV